VASPKILLGISILLLGLSLVLGLLNTSKVKRLRDDLASSVTDKETAMRSRAASDKKLKAREKEFADTTARVTAADEKATSAEAELSKAQKKEAELEAKLHANETRIADLQKGTPDATGSGTGGEAILPNDLKMQLDDAKKQLEAAEQEKSILGDKVKAAQDRVAAMEEAKKRRGAGANMAGVHGLVLAVNQAYNFVVLSMGERQGVVANSEMLVLRQGALIGKIRISSVEPTTAIGDIITNSLARGVQVQPGDTVIYAGNTNS
jgi:chaperonin cofactor prefoldin